MNDDTEFQEHTVEEVLPEDKGWAVKADGWSLYVPNTQCEQAPAVGETARYYGRGIGHPVRGIVIGGRVYRYETAEQAEENHRKEQERRRQEKLYDYQKNQADFDRRVGALPEPLRLRVQRFRRIGGLAWSAEFEPYELFVCEQAAVFHETFATTAELHAFAASPNSRQHQLCPKLSDEHSGNTFGAAVTLASMLKTHPHLLEQQHGALCPLVGCQNYGCYAATQEQG